MTKNMRVRARNPIVETWEGADPHAILIPIGTPGIAYGPVLCDGRWRVAVTWQGLQSGVAGITDIPFDTSLLDIEYVGEEDAHE